MVFVISEPMMLDQGSAPLYHQLKNIIQSRILSDEFVEYLVSSQKYDFLERDYDARGTVHRCLQPSPMCLNQET